MAERKMLFSLDSERIEKVWGGDEWHVLQHEFRTRNLPLSDSLLIWRNNAEQFIVDFESERTYDFKKDDAADTNTVQVWEGAGHNDQFAASSSVETTLSDLRYVRMTLPGFVDSLRRLDLDKIDFEALKRSDLSGAGFSFEFLNRDLSIVYGMIRDILTSSRESLLHLSREQLYAVTGNLQGFYQYVRQIEGFKTRGEDPNQAHTEFVSEILRFCDSARGVLRDIIAYLSSRKVDELDAQVNTTIGEATERLESATNRAQQYNDDFERQEKTRQEEFEELKLELQNQLAEKPISQYRAIFQEQAEKHQKGARFWLGMTGVATGAFALAFFLLSMFLKFEGAGLNATLQNLFTKGFLLSPIYVWLNRSIKNHTAQKHLEVINTHRQNALETFDTFVAAAEGNRETRDAVLLAATEAIFDANQTGYLSTKGSGPDSRNPILHIIRESLTQKSSSKQG